MCIKGREHKLYQVALLFWYVFFCILMVFAPRAPSTLFAICTLLTYIRVRGFGPVVD